MSLDELFSLEGRTALVTGASRGLGRAMAEALARAGAEVALTSTERSGTDATAKSVRAANARTWQFGADLSRSGAPDELADAVLEAVGPVDVLVNAAGTTRRSPARDHDLEDWDEVTHVNLRAAFRLCVRFGRPMIERGRGKIINVASLLAFQGGKDVVSYAASKHGLVGVTRSLANEWAREGVQVNAIAPGYFRTDLTEPLQQDPDRAREIEERIPAGRWGRPEDLAGATVFLASSASDYVNGTVLTVDGGWMAR